MSKRHDNSFDDLYDRLAQRWSRHQELRGNGSVTITELAGSWSQVDDARSAMAEWWKNHQLQGIR